MSTIVWILNFCIDLTYLSFWWIQKKGLTIKVGQILKDIACSIFHRILKIGTACRSTKQICLFTVSNGLTYWNRQSCIRFVYFLIKCPGNNFHFFCYYALKGKSYIISDRNFRCCGLWVPPTLFHRISKRI